MDTPEADKETVRNLHQGRLECVKTEALYNERSAGRGRFR